MTKTSIRQGYKNKFTSVSNKLAQNNALSLKARGLMLYFLSLPDDWLIYVDQLSKVMKEKRKAILSGISELKEAGYVHHVKLGFKEGWQYFTFGEPISEDEFKLFLRTEPFRNSSETEQFQKEQLQKTNLKDKEQTYIEKDIVPSVENDLVRHIFIKYNEYRKSINLEECKESLITPNWDKEAKRLLKTHTLEKLIQLIDFAFQDKFWKTVIASPTSLRKHLLKLEELQALSNKPNQDQPVDIEKFKADYEQYKKWYDQTSDPIMKNRGFLKIKEGKFYNTINPNFKWNLRYDKYMKVLKDMIPEHILHKIVNGEI